ncbi:hypothetical protein T440DRAFT_502082 [Plenodomus tracheiphilus IPT5]|uniref:Ribosome assembly protein 3 n=1 Tax=Plenodomus tracheiphilus IPT5 TaxID=1408161 RepID=A0A6A7AV90_9PLEO|nr:hypothetical protein T440DRAFT_502082 [Plenodomus tracheiphilus IPT5]
MARFQPPAGAVPKRKSKKRKARTEVSSSSESDSDVESSSRSSFVEPVNAAKDVSPVPAPAPTPAPAPVEEEEAPKPAKKEKKKKEKKTKSATTVAPEPDNHADVAMEDAPSPTPTATKSTRQKPSKPIPEAHEEFEALYLRKVAAELADDLDKVREAQDFKANSVPMLIHALKQGASLFSVEEKRRVVGAVV